MPIDRLALVGVLLLCAPAVAQMAWTQVPSAYAFPTARVGTALAYDSLRQRFVLFGGGDSAGGYLGDTWEWNGTTWSQVSMSGPPPRSGHGIAYDSARGRTVLFGGTDGATGPFGDTWEWNGATWTQVAATGPAARSGHAMAFDVARSRTVLFGANNSTAAMETWEWDGTTWVDRTGSTSPSVRTGFRMAFDTQRSRTVLHGGLTGPGYIHLDDTWEWDGSAWTLRSASGPGPRFAHALAYGPSGRVIMFGGTNWPGTGSIVFADTWEWDGTAWSQLAVNGPVARVNHAMAYDSARNRACLLGGSGLGLGSGTGDTWALCASPCAWPAANATPFGVGCGVPVLTLSAAAPPILGATAQAGIANVPAGFAVVSLGWNTLSFGPWSLPMTLAWLGMPGCDLQHSTDVFGLTATPTGSSTATFSQPLPHDSSLVGRHVYVQSFAVAPGVNPAGVIASNGMDWLLGY